MTNEEIIIMAREAARGRVANTEIEARSLVGIEEIKRFAALVAAAEREACASIVENADTPDCGGWTAIGIADAIRARGNA